MRFLYLYPPTPVSVTFPPGSATEATQEEILGALKVESKGFRSMDLSAIDNSTYTNLGAVTSGEVTKLQIFVSTGDPIYLAFGSTDQMIITPGMNYVVDLLVPSGTQLTLKLVSAASTTGYIYLNMMGPA